MSNNRTTLGKAGAGTVNAFRFCKRNALVIDQASTSQDEILGVAAETATTGKQLAIIIEGLCEVDFGAAVAPGTLLTSDANGKAVAAAVAVPTQLIVGEYCPEPVNGAVANSTSGARGRVLLYSNKMTVKV